MTDDGKDAPRADMSCPIPYGELASPEEENNKSLQRKLLGACPYHARQLAKAINPVKNNLKTHGFIWKSKKKKYYYTTQVPPQQILV